jgi:hypothetical protein
MAPLPFHSPLPGSHSRKHSELIESEIYIDKVNAIYVIAHPLS